LFGLNPLLLAGISAAAIAGAWWLGHEAGLTERDGKLGRNFEQALTREREVGIRREVNLWTQIGDERRARIEMIATFQKVDTLSVEARAKLMAAMAEERRASEAALTSAMQNIQELKDAASDMAEAWKRGAIPADIVCGVFNGKGCPAPAYPAIGADRDDGVEVRDGAGAADPGTAPGLP
jgi:hypothetical protein